MAERTRFAAEGARGGEPGAPGQLTIDGDAGDVMTQYQIFDDNADASSGRFMSGSKVLNADTTYTVTAASFAKLTYAAGSATGTDLLWVRAFDGDSWSDWHNFNAHTIV